MDIIAVIILTKFSGRVFFWMFDKWMISYGDEIDEEKKKLRKELHWSTYWAVCLLIIGFVLQIVGNLFLDPIVKNSFQL